MIKYISKTRPGTGAGVKKDGASLSVGQSADIFSLPEILMIVGMAVLFDLYEVVAALTTVVVIGVVLYIIGIILDIGWLVTVNLMFALKGGKWALNLVGDLVELIPGIDILPIRTAVVIIAIVWSNHSAKKTNEGA